MFMIEKAMTGSRRYWTWILGLLLVMGIGILAHMRQLEYGLGVTGLSRDVTWGLYIAQFTFLAGIAASAVIVVMPFYLSDYKIFSRIVLLSEFLAISCVTMSLLFVLADMGQPARVFNVLLHPAPGSMMFWDMVALFGYVALNAVIALATLRAEQRGEPPAQWVRPLIFLSIPWAVGMRTVSALLYSGLPGRSFWLTAILAPRALASAIAAGPALLILLCLLLRKIAHMDIGQDSIRKLARVVYYAMLTYWFLTLMEAFTVFYSGAPEPMEHYEYLLLGLDGHTSMVPWTWTAVGLSLGAVLGLGVKRWRENSRILVPALSAAFLSLWIEKGLGMVVGGFVPSPLGHVSEYVPTITEWAVTFGIWAAGMLMLTVFYKITLEVRAGLARQTQEYAG